jgi:hypothetical protein
LGLIVRFGGWADPTPGGVEAHCREAQANFVARRDLPYLIVERASATLVGSTGMHRMNSTVPEFDIEGTLHHERREPGGRLRNSRIHA